MPDNVPLENAASVPTCLATAIAGIWAHGPGAESLNHVTPWEEGGKTKYAGQPAFILGGSSSVGQFGALYYLAHSLCRSQF